MSTMSLALSQRALAPPVLAQVVRVRLRVPRGVGMTGGQHPDHTEGVVARSIEHYTAQIPSDAFLWAAAGSIGLSLCLRLSGNRHDALFVGQWAPTFLLLGLYNKLVKVAGSDPQHRGLAGGNPQMAGRGAGI